MIRTAMKGPFRVLPRIVDQIRLVEKQGRCVLIEFRKGDSPVHARGLMVFGSSEDADGLAAKLDAATGRDDFIDVLRDANYVLCSPAIDGEDDIALYGYPVFAPDILKTLLQKTRIDARAFIPETLSGFDPTTFWSSMKPADVALPNKPFERTTKNRVMRKSHSSVLKSRYSNRAGPIPLELKNRYLQALHACGSTLEADPMPVSPYETALKLDELRDRALRPTPAQIRYARAISKALGVVPSFDMLKANRSTVGAFIKQHHKRMQQLGRA